MQAQHGDLLVVDPVGGDFAAATIVFPVCATNRAILPVLWRDPYLERRGAPKRPADIGDHDCVHWRVAAGGGAWSFVKNGERVTVPIRGRLLISNFATQREAALRGVGLAILPLLSVREDLEAGRLVSVLPDYEVHRGELSLVRPPTPFEPPKLRAFIDFITAALRERARYDPH